MEVKTEWEFMFVLLNIWTVCLGDHALATEFYRIISPLCLPVGWTLGRHRGPALPKTSCLSGGWLHCAGSGVRVE